MSPTDPSAAARFAGTVRFPTISLPGRFSLDPFHAMREYACSQWPGVFSTMELEVLGGASILLRWQGLDDGSQALLLTAHQDVVPPGEGNWSFDPFCGRIMEGRVLGRGTIDYKCGFAGMLEACESLIGSGFTPSRTVYLAFGHDEEVGGFAGAGAITANLLEKGARCSSVLDEGGYVYPFGNGSEKAVVAVAEKGYATFRITSRAVQGHSSTPPAETAIGTLARALCILDDLGIHDPSLPPELRDMDFAGTTIAPTVIKGGCRENVLPACAEALVNTRPAPLSSVAEVQREISGALEGLAVRVELVDDPSVSEPSRLSSTDTEDFKSIRSAIADVLGPVPVVPGIFPAATDSRRYGKVADQTYRFLPVRLGPRGIGELHSVDESISVKDYLNCVRFYAQYITRAASNC